nr:homeobox-leucine zipper protein ANTHOCYANINLESS 2-like isoform X1 [Ipomoea batatas]
MVADSRPYSSMTTQPQMVAPPMVQPPRSMFNTPPLSLALKPKMEGLGELGMIGENFDPGSMGRAREDEYESRSGSENFEGASGDDQDNTPGDKSSKRKKYHRHTPYQIQELESAFKENPHPDEKSRLELGRRLNLESKQVKFWFQNRRTQMKTQLERHENAILKQENDKLRIENIAMKEAMSTPICNQCGGQAILGEVHVEEHHLRIENARLRDELNRICVLANKFLGKPFSSFPGAMAPPAMANSGLELAVGRNSFGGLNPVDSSLPLGLDFGNGISSGMPLMPSRATPNMSGVEASYDKSVFMELAFTAMNELLKLAEIGEPLWYRSLDGFAEALNLEEYDRTFHSCLGMRPTNFITEATRASGTVIFNSMALVETLMDANRWAEMFTGLVGRASIIDVISSNSSGSRNGFLQLMHGELQILSPLVPLHHVKFLRFCKQHAEGVWAIVDVSVDMIREGTQPHEFPSCRILPSGCIVQDMPNGYSKVIWIQHMEYDDSTVHNFFRPLIRSGMGLGAQRWLATLQRQCECLTVIMSSSMPSTDNSGVSHAGRRSIASLAQRMTRSFCAVVCGNIYKWEPIQTGNGDDAARLNMRKSIGEPGEPPGVVLSATKTIWLPISRQHLFDFLRSEETRNQWDVLSNGTLQQMIHISKGQDTANQISLYRNTASASVNQNSMLILQESCNDIAGSLIAYASVGAPEMTMVMNGGDSSCVALLPSGFSIVPDCFNNSGWPDDPKGTLPKEGGPGNNSTGALLTVGFQMLVSSLPGAKLTMESVETVNALISRMVMDIKAAFHCN